MEPGRTGDFDYFLPEERIAQTPVEPRDSSRLLVLDRNRPDGRFEHRNFRDLTEYLRPGDLMVFNRSRVIPARLYGTETRSGARVEVLLVRRQEPGIWQALGRPGRRLRVGSRVTVEAHDGSGSAEVEILAARENGLRLVRVSDDSALDGWASFHCLRILRRPPRIPTGIRPSTRTPPEAWPLPPRDCISPKLCSTSFARKGSNGVGDSPRRPRHVPPGPR